MYPLNEGTILCGKYRVKSYVGKIKHGEFHWSSYIYQDTRDMRRMGLLA